MTKAPTSPSKPSTKPKPKPTKPKRKCKRCDKTLMPIGDRRKRGTRRHNDWSSRQYHKKCSIFGGGCARKIYFILI